MNLFEKSKVKTLRYAKEAEENYSYLVQSARPEMLVVKNYLEHLFKLYPRSDKEEIQSRFRKGGDKQFYAVFWELYINSIFQELNCKVETHPDLDGELNTHPDFLFKNESGDEFYIECVTLSEYSDKQRTILNVRKNLIDCINKLKNKKYYIRIGVEGIPEYQFSCRRIKDFLNRKLNNCEFEEIKRNFDLYSIDGLPKWIYEENGKTIEFNPIPIEIKNDPTGRIIGISPGGSFWNNIQYQISKTLNSKARKYGKLKKPFIIAINIQSRMLREEDLIDVLWGVSAYNSVYEENYGDGNVRILNGFWHDRTHPKNTRVTGILTGFNLSPYESGNIKMHYYENFFSKYKFDDFGLNIPKIKIVGNEIIKVDAAC